MKAPTGVKFTSAEQALRRALMRKGYKGWQVYDIIKIVYRWQKNWKGYGA